MAVYLLSSGSYSLEFFPRPLGRDKGTYGSVFIQDVKCGSNHRERMTRKGWDTGSQCSNTKVY
jgi:hypothetical protein